MGHHDGIITGTYVYDELPFPVLTAQTDISLGQSTWFGNGGDSVFLTFAPNPDGVFGNFARHTGSFTITGGTGNYAGATGGGQYEAFSRASSATIRSMFGFNTGEITLVPEPSTTVLLLAGAGLLLLALRRGSRLS